MARDRLVRALSITEAVFGSDHHYAALPSATSVWFSGISATSEAPASGWSVRS